MTLFDTTLRATALRSGLITASLVEDVDGPRIVGPLFFDEALVAEHVSHPIPHGTSPEDALEDAYLAAFPAWCARKDAACATQETPRTVSYATPTPDRSRDTVPFGWMARDPSFVR